MDLVKLETARQVFAQVFAGLNGEGTQAFIVNAEVRSQLAAACTDFADQLCIRVGESKGHPAETALEQLFDLLASHEDKVLVKWVKANAKVRGLTELCAYLGAERE